MNASRQLVSAHEDQVECARLFTVSGKGKPMYGAPSRESIKWLWWITGINIGGGALVWLYNAAMIQFGDLYSSEELSAISWQATGSAWIGFGILALIVTLATSAIVVGQIEAVRRLEKLEKDRK